MTTDPGTLARRAIAAPGWRWMPGMRVFGGELVLDVRPGHLMLAQLNRWRDDPRAYQWITIRGPAPADLQLPDLDDPATLGCLLAIVREAWDDPELHATLDTAASSRVWICWLRADDDDDSDDGWVSLSDGRTEAEALVAALEAAPAGEAER